LPAEQGSQRPTAHRARADHAIVAAPSGATSDCLTEYESFKPPLRFEAATLMQFGRIEIGEPNLDPAIGPPGWSDAQTITVANVADDTFEARVPGRKRTFARVGVRRGRP
jgi:hypothetical protein